MLTHAQCGRALRYVVLLLWKRGYVPFPKSDGEKYIEVHHIVTLANGGLDVLENVACVCPTHHRELHCGENASGLSLLLQGIRVKEAV